MPPKPTFFLNFFKNYGFIFEIWLFLFQNTLIESGNILLFRVFKTFRKYYRVIEERQRAFTPALFAAHVKVNIFFKGSYNPNLLSPLSAATTACYRAH